MLKSKVLMVIVSLSLATMACSLTRSGQAAEPKVPTAFPTVAASLAQPATEESASESTVTSVSGSTVNVARETGSAASDSGAADTVGEPESSGQAGGTGEAIAVAQLSALQSVEAQFYVPNCTPVLNWPLYTVVAGDTLYNVATRHGMSWQNLAQANCLANPNLIYIGQALHVPPSPAPPPDHTDGNLPVIANPAMPNPPGCNVFVANMSKLVPVYTGPGTGFGMVAYLYNYAQWLESNLDGYRILFPFGGSGWVSKQVTYVGGDCGFELPEYNHPGPNPPLDSCSAVPPAGAGRIARIYTAPGGQGDVIGRLGNYAPVIQWAEGSYEIALPAWTMTGWVRETDIGLVGTCPDFHNPPTPIPTVTPQPPFSDLPRVSNPGRPAPQDCVVRVKVQTLVLIYPGPVSTGPIAVLDNYAPYIDSVDGGYVIALSPARQGWVAESDTQLEGQCFSISGGS